MTYIEASSVTDVELGVTTGTTCVGDCTHTRRPRRPAYPGRSFARGRVDFSIKQNHSGNPDFSLAPNYAIISQLLPSREVLVSRLSLASSGKNTITRR